jgi:hypothetical protein
MDFFTAQDCARPVEAAGRAVPGGGRGDHRAIYFIVHATVGSGLRRRHRSGAVRRRGRRCRGARRHRQHGAHDAAAARRRRRWPRCSAGGACPPASQDEHERRLINVVEEMAIASGTPVPAIYVLDARIRASTRSLRATRSMTRPSPSRAARCSALNRQELQGVIAHEFSHILNGDMRLNIRLVGLLFGILLLAVVGRGLLRGGYISGGGRRGRSRGGAQAAASAWAWSPSATSVSSSAG